MYLLIVTNDNTDFIVTVFSFEQFMKLDRFPPVKLDTS